MAVAAGFKLREGFAFQALGFRDQGPGYLGCLGTLNLPCWVWFKDLRS